MARETLSDLFRDLAVARGPFLALDDGYRSRSHTYAEVAGAAEGLAGRLHHEGLAAGDSAVIWAESSPEWIVAFWGCVLAGVVVVPLDPSSPPAFVARVVSLVRPRLVLAGDAQEAEALGSLDPAIRVWRLRDLDWADPRRMLSPPALAPGQVAEIIFTSGATAEPRGVVLTHRNLLASVVPVEREIAKYRRWARPFLPLRFLNLLPLSHMFGQALATFIPPALPGTVIFTRSQHPAEIARLLRRWRVSVLVSVPKVLEVLRAHAVAIDPSAGRTPGRGGHVARRWWRYRRIHRRFGWKFWAFVVGGAPLDPDLEEFWGRLGFLVVQGYGLTETAPIVSLNHPFAAARGSVGKPLPGVEVRLADDGEILVRGANVTPGYYGSPEATSAAFEGGWLRTGDIGEIDGQGRLFVRGRKKDLIVTPEGLNVHPEDVERALAAVPGVREAAVVGLPEGNGERVQAVLVTEPGLDIEAVVRTANSTLAGHQRVRAAQRWPGSALPRTTGTGKLKRREVRAWLEGAAPGEPGASRGQGLVSLLARYAGTREIRPETPLEELGLSSLERIELLMSLEAATGGPIDEREFAAARTVGEVERLAAGGGRERQGGTIEAPSPLRMPAWARGRLARAVRRIGLATFILPLAGAVARRRVEGVRRLDAVGGPVLLAANHQSLLDVPVILAALPRRLRRRTAVAMALEVFEGRRLAYGLAVLFFNGFSLPQRAAGLGTALRYMGELMDEGWSVLLFPEGRRTDTGEIRPFLPGVGLAAERLRAPVIPVRLEGLDRVWHRTWRWPRPGRVRVAFGAPIHPRGSESGRLATEVEQAVREL